MKSRRLLDKSMNIIPVSDLYRYNYSIDVVNSLRQSWYTHCTYSCINRPKDRDMLLYLDKCDARYSLKSGEEIFAKSGSLVYIPISSEYVVRLFNIDDTLSSTVGINLYMYDENNKPFIMSDKITVFSHIECRHIVNKINDASASSVPCYGKMKAGVYEIISMLSEKQKIGKRFKIIEKGINYLENDFTKELSMSEIAKMCNVSEIYFRKLFKEYSGLAPTQYRLKAKLDKAKVHLEHDNLNIAEIAEILNFTDASYFCRQFKAYMELTPLKFRMKIKKM